MDRNSSADVARVVGLQTEAVVVTETRLNQGLDASISMVWQCITPHSPSVQVKSFHYSAVRASFNGRVTLLL